MRRPFRVAAVAAALSLVLPIAAVQADPGLSVYIEIHTFIPEPGIAFGSFEATGNAVFNGVVCDLGQTEDVYVAQVGGGPNNRANYQVLKKFTCAAEPSNTFTLKLQIRSDPSGRGGTYSWIVFDGDGDYVNLRGSGTGYSQPPPPNVDYQVRDILAGVMR